MNKESWNKFYKRYQLFIFPAGVAVSCLILVVFVMIPQIGKIIQGTQRQAEIRTKSQFLSTKVEALEGYDEGALQQKVSYLIASLPAEKDFVNIIGLLQKLTSENGFSIISLSLGSSGAPSSQEQSYGVKLETLGSKSLLSRLLNSIENSPRLIRISDMEISAGKAGDFVNVSLTIEVLFSPMPKELGGVDSPLPEVSESEEALIKRLARTQVPATTVSPTSVTLTPRGKANPFE